MVRPRSQSLDLCVSVSSRSSALSVSRSSSNRDPFSIWPDRLT